MMDHPNIARVLDAGATASGRPYVVMELVKGIPITRYCDQEHLTPQERLALFIPVCQAVQHAHQKGIIHRDLKPSNVIVALYDGVPVPKVIDFGIAKATGQKLTEHTLFTEVGQILGTLEYMSPEQAELNNLDIDTRADIYSLGVLLYELLTGSPPFTSKQLRSAAFTEMLRIIREVEPPKPSTKLSSSDELPSIAAKRKLEPRRLTRLVHGDLDWIVMKCLEKERGRRYETANALAMELQRYLADEPVLAGPPGPGYRLRKFVRRHRGPVLAAALVLLALLGGITGATWGLVRAERARRAEAEARQAEEEQRQLAQTKEQEAVASAAQEAEQRRLAEEQRDQARRLRAEAQRNLYFSHMHQAERAWDDADVGRVLNLLGKYTAPREENEPDLRGFEWYYLRRLCHTDLITFHGHTETVNSVRFSPDGRRLASASGDGAVKVWDVQTGEEILSVNGRSDWVYSVCFSPDGKRLASASRDKTVKIWDAHTGQEVLSLKGHTSWVRSVSFSPDGRRLASAGGAERAPGKMQGTPGEIRVWDAQTGREILSLTGHTGTASSVSFSPDGRRLASGSWDQSVRIWDALNGQEALVLKGHTADVESVSFSPDGRHLASGSLDSTVRVWDALTGREVLAFKGHTDHVMSVCFSPDSQRVASASKDMTVKLWSANTGQDVVTLKGHTGRVEGISFSPDGQRLASASVDNTVKVWDAQTGQEAVALRGHTDGLHCAIFSPEGRRLASASWDKSVKLWDVETGQETLALRGHAGPVTSVSFSPNGRRLASASQDQTVKVWDVQTGQEILSLRQSTPVASVSFSPDGQHLAGACSNTVKLWDAQTGRETITLSGRMSVVHSISFSPDGRRLACGFQGSSPKIWDIRTGQVVLSLNHGETVWTVSFSPDGQRLASGGDSTVRVWDAQTGQAIHTLRGHTAAIYGVCFSPDGMRLASASRDRTTKVWDVQTGQETLTLKGHTNTAWGVSFSPDGRRLASASWDQSVRIWDARPLSSEVEIELEAWAVIRRLHFGRLLLKEDVPAALRADQTLREAVRKKALAIAERLQDPTPVRLNQASWAIVSLPGASADQYGRALRWAESACRQKPEVANLLRTLGVAQYRAGKLSEALQTLQWSDELNRAQFKSSRPDDLAFLAMIYHRLGREDQAQECLEQLRKVMAQPRWTIYEEGKRFLQEAEALLKGPAPKKLEALGKTSTSIKHVPTRPRQVGRAQRLSREYGSAYQGAKDRLAARATELRASRPGAEGPTAYWM
jgi:WD40 repeat protein